MKFALVSLNQHWENKDLNKKRINKIVEKLSNYKLDWVIFPEITLTGFSMNCDKIADKNNETLLWFKELAKNIKINIIFGAAVLEKDMYKNKAYAVSADGEVLCEYSKIHLFSIAKENIFYKAGEQVACFNYKNTNIGLTICYDLRFPELYQTLSKQCYIIINIANWPAVRKDHWFTLLKARSIENQSFFIGVNRIGIDGNNLSYEKSSIIYSPNGELLKPDFKSREFDIFEIELSIVDKIRSSFPVQNDRKGELYAKWYKDFRK